MSEIERTITASIPEFLDIRIRRNGDRREMIVAFRIERESFQAVRDITNKVNLLERLNEIAVSMIEEQYGLDGFTAVI